MPPVEQIYAENLALKEELSVLRAQIAWLKQKLFGGGQSERVDRAQLLLTLGELEKLAACNQQIDTISYERTKPSGEKRTVPAQTFAHLPVKETIVIEPEEVKANPQAFEKIGEERTFEVDVVPPKLFKREIVRPKYQRKAVPSEAPIVAPAPARVVPGGYASAGLLAWITVSKYVDHLPLYRLEQMSGRWGATLPRQSMVEWVRITAETLEPLYKRMLSDLLAGGYVQADETPVKCNDPDHKNGGTTQGYLWVLSRPGGDVVFDWKLSRKHGELTSLLTADYKGVLQSDGYEAYAAYARSHDKVFWVGCWAHARRYFFEAQGQSHQRVGFILRLIGQLYRYERAWDQAKVNGPNLRAALRQSHFSLTLSLLEKTARRLQEIVLPQSLLGKACTYLLNQWKPLTAHLSHGQTKIDNNAIENALRPTAIGKKNWLFIGHPEAGQRSAIIYTLIVSCRRYGKDPLTYLRDVLTRLPGMTNKDDLAPLLPAHWQPPQTVVSL